MNRLFLITVLALAAVSAFVLSIIVDSGEEHHGSRSGPKSWQEQLVGRGKRQLEGPPRSATALSARFGPPEGIPHETQAAIERNIGGGRRLALRYKEAQSLQAPAHVHLWLIEGSAVACLFVAAKPAPASVCRTTVQAAADGLSLGTYKTDPRHPGKPTHFLVAGIDPRDISSLNVVIGEKPVRIPVRNGVWAVRAKDPILPARQG